MCESDCPTQQKEGWVGRPARGPFLMGVMHQDKEHGYAEEDEERTGDESGRHASRPGALDVSQLAHILPVLPADEDEQQGTGGGEPWRWTGHGGLTLAPLGASLMALVVTILLDSEPIY
jgi:hypothetical protein